MGKAKLKKNNDSTIMEGNELKSLIIIIIIVSAIFLAFYGITTLTSKKQTSGSEYEVKSETIQYDEIMVGQILNQKGKEYYVLIKNQDNFYNDLYTYYLKNYASKNSKKYYTVDLSNAFNSSYVGENTKVDTKSFFNSRFANTTLLLIKNKKVSKIYSTDEQITEILKKIAA